jgi:hypothetical protein
MRSAFAWIERTLLATALALAPGCRTAPDAAAGATLTVETVAEDRDADVWVDGNYVGRVADLGGSLGSVRLAPGVHRVEVRKPGRFPVQRTVKVDRNGPRDVTVEAELLEDPQ